MAGSYISLPNVVRNVLRENMNKGKKRVTKKELEADLAALVKAVKEAIDSDEDPEELLKQIDESNRLIVALLDEACSKKNKKKRNME